MAQDNGLFFVCSLDDLQIAKERIVGVVNANRGPVINHMVMTSLAVSDDISAPF